MRQRFILLSIAIAATSVAWAGSADAEAPKKCLVCRGVGFEPCPDCQIQGRPTGKARCPQCNGARRATCPDCNGTRGIVCDVCGGNGRKVVNRSSRITSSVTEQAYESCTYCSGTGMTHIAKDDPNRRPGPCPTCNQRGLATRLLGTIPCPGCKGTGLTGPCPTCAGSKRIPCRRCTPTTQPTSQPATRPAVRTGGPPRLPSDFKAPAAQAAAQAYEEGVRKAEADYAAALAELQASHRRKIDALIATAATALDAAMKLVTQSGDLEEAIKIRDAAKALRVPPPTRPASAPAPAPTAPASAPWPPL